MNHNDITSDLPLQLGRALRRMARTTFTYPESDYNIREWRQALHSQGNYLLAYGWRQRHGLTCDERTTTNAQQALAWVSVMLPRLWS